MKNVDFGLTAIDYARHRAGFPTSLFERLVEFGIGRTNQHLVDLGTGTGSLARGFATRGCRVIGIDPAEDMLAQAMQLDQDASVDIDYKVATAEDTGLPANSADVVTAGQCWHWFDRPAATREITRILHPGGQLLIAHFDWIPIAGNVVAATEALIEKHNPNWDMGGGTGLYPQWLRGLSEAGYHDIQTFSYDEHASYTPEAWRGRIRASAGVGAALAPDQVAVFNNELDALLREKFPAKILQVPHRVFALIAKSPLD